MQAWGVKSRETAIHSIQPFILWKKRPTFLRAQSCIICPQKRSWGEDEEKNWGRRTQYRNRCCCFCCKTIKPDINFCRVIKLEIWEAKGAPHFPWKSELFSRIEKEKGRAIFTLPACLRAWVVFQSLVSYTLTRAWPREKHGFREWEWTAPRYKSQPLQSRPYFLSLFWGIWYLLSQLRREINRK